MLDRDQYQRISQALPFLQHADPRMVDEFVRTAFFVHLPAGRDVFVEDDQVDSIALLISGTVRVYKISETGREITLYRFGLGESCILTANAILSRRSFPAIATVDKDAEAVMVPAEALRDWVRRYDLWREFIFELLSQRLATMMTVVEEVAFRRMDARIAGFLLQRAQSHNPISITHQEIASELGSSREVVSRILEDFSELGWIRVGRGKIEILDFAGLQKQTVV